MTVGHLFFDHANNLRLVNLYYAHGSELKEFFQKWLDEYPDPYRRQLHRKSIPFGWVKNNGTLLMTITDGEVTFPESAKLDPQPTKI